MRCAYLYYYANLGGVTSVIKSRMAAMAEKGWTVHAYFEKDVGGVADLKQSGLSGVEVVSNLKERFPTIQKEERYDVVTAFDMPELLLPIRSVFSGPLIYEVHTPIERVLMKTAVADADASDVIIVPSEWSKQWIIQKLLWSWDPNRIHVVPNIIDRRIFYPLPANDGARRKQVIWIGKVAAYKRWRDAVRTLGRVREAIDCDIIFITGGEMNERTTEEFISEVLACGLMGRSTWYHNLPIEEMANIYRDCHASRGIVLSTSEAESFCLVAHEAMSCGVPVVTAAAGALPEVYNGTLAKLLFEIGDVGDAERIITRALKEPAFWLEMSRDGVQAQKRYDSKLLGYKYVESVQSIPLDRHTVEPVVA